MALFLVDFADMYFISLLGEVELAAAIGYAGSILFFNVSIGIGLAITASALVARAVGAGDQSGARRLCTNSLVFAAVSASVLAFILWIFVPEILSLLGAEGRAHALATSYLRIIVPTMPALALGILWRRYIALDRRPNPLDVCDPFRRHRECAARSAFDI